PPCRDQFFQRAGYVPGGRPQQEPTREHQQEESKGQPRFHINRPQPLVACLGERNFSTPKGNLPGSRRPVARRPAASAVGPFNGWREERVSPLSQTVQLPFD